ncbi:MAG: carbohydrate-binding protein [Verrucomicrobiota bacterium]
MILAALLLAPLASLYAADVANLAGENSKDAGQKPAANAQAPGQNMAGAAPVAALGAARAAEFHVATNGSDANRGTKSAPFRTIRHAADLAQPGDIITVHAGIYRERVNPPRGGTSDAQRIVYQAAPGEKVAIKGSEVAKGWVKVENDTWKLTLPNSFFGKYNPYRDHIRGDWFDDKGRKHHTGAVYVNGGWLMEAARLEDVLRPKGAASVGGAQPGVHLLNVAWFRPGKGGDKAAQIPADRYTAKQGPRNAPCTEGGQCIGWIGDGAWVKYERVDFGERTESVEVRAASPSGGGQIELRLDSANGELVGTCAVADTGDWQGWQSFRAAIKPTSGVKNLCLVFRPPMPKPASGGLWFGQVDPENTTIWAQFKDTNPNEQLVEINVRPTVFYPDQPGRNFITVRGFTLEHAATQWAPPTAEQPGLIGTHWSKGWIIENNTVRFSKCSGIALGKYGDEFDNKSANSAEGYVKTIERAHAHSIAWTKANIGHHVVRDNTISHCEQTGIVGSLGCSFSTVTGNVIHDIHVRRLFSGAEMAGIKFHGAIDTEIRGNHIYRACRGMHLDWMAQGTRVSGNLLHDNSAEDIYVEVNHGPFILDNNLLLSPRSLWDMSEGGAYVHNLLTGKIDNWYDMGRPTPYMRPHSTAIAGLAVTQGGGNRYFNNIFVGRGFPGEAPVQTSDPTQSITGHGLWVYDVRNKPPLTGGNVYLNGARSCSNEVSSLTFEKVDPSVKVVEQPDGWFLEMICNKTWSAGSKCKTVTMEMLGKAPVPMLPYENPDGSSMTIDSDYSGKKHDVEHPTSGPFAKPDEGNIRIKVWK